MNAQREQAYLNLIQRLLNSPSSEVPQILQTNRELLDADFLQMVDAVAQRLSQQGNENAANRLRSLEVQLGKALNLSSPTVANLSEQELQAHWQFLMQVLQATADSEGDVRVIYPLLVQNTACLNLTLAEVLWQWATTTLPKRQPDEACSIAGDIVRFSNRIQKFPLGNKASNMEIAIAGYKGVLTLFTRDAFPQQWAMTQNNLGIAYLDRIVGDRTQNLELALAAFTVALQVCTREAFPQQWAMTQNHLGNAYSYRILGDKAQHLELAISAYTAALQVYTREAFPQQWAMTQNNLGIAYRDRIVGNKAQNLELAIAAYTAALQVYTREAFPQQWAMTQNHLGNAYSYRILGDKAQHLELAIAAYTAALQVYTRKAFPQDWAMTQNNLGIAYWNRIVGDRAQNLERAISAFTVALQVCTREAFPQQWAMTQNNLGNAYRDRILGDKAQNLERAIAACTVALQVRTREAFPQDWVMTQNNLGNAYLDRILGDKAQNLELAIAAYTAALEIYTREAFPQDWAMTQNNLGLAYSKRILGDKAQNLEQVIASFTAALQVLTHDAFPQQWAITQNNLGLAYGNRILGDKAQNLERAIAACSAALQVLTRDAFPENWAMTQHNLGNAYSNRILGDKRENLELAIASYSAALEVRTCDAFPQNHAKTLLNLGILYQDAQRFAEAYTTFNRAIETVEFLRGDIVSGDESKRKQSEEWNQLYRCMVEVCLEQDNITEAIEYAERSKTRNLVELILERDLKTIFPSEDVTNFPSEDVTRLEQLRDEIARGQYQLQNGKAENPKALAQHLQQLRQQRNDLQNHHLPIGYGFNLDRFQATLDEHTAIVEWYITNTGFETFIITCDNLQRLKISNAVEQKDAVADWVIEYLKAHYLETEWEKSLASRLSRLAEILHLEDILTLVPKTCSRLVLIPHRFLHLFPLQALPISQNGKTVCLLDRFPNGVSYAPSCQLLLQAQQRKRPNFTHLFAIQNPTSDLAYTDLEVQAITGYFNPVNILKHETATLTAINEANLNAIHCAHFSCHGYFNQRNARKSALILADAPLATAPTQPDTERYLNVRESETHDLNQCLTLDAILSLNLEQCRLVTLSACETGLIDFTNISDEYIGLPSGFLIAGSPSVVSSLWRVNDLSTTLLMIKFYQKLKSGLAVAIALNQAQTWLRDATKEQLEQWAKQLPNANHRRQLKIYLNKQLPNTKPFESPYYWAAFCAIGQ